MPDGLSLISATDAQERPLLEEVANGLTGNRRSVLGEANRQRQSRQAGITPPPAPARHAWHDFGGASSIVEGYGLSEVAPDMVEITRQVNGEKSDRALPVYRGSARFPFLFYAFDRV